MEEEKKTETTKEFNFKYNTLNSIPSSLIERMEEDSKTAGFKDKTGYLIDLLNKGLQYKKRVKELSTEGSVKSLAYVRTKMNF